MKLPVLVEPVPGKGFVARVSAPFNWSAEGATADEAVSKLQAEATAHLRNGSRAAEIDFPSRAERMWLDHPKLDLNDPVVREWLQIVQDNRRAADTDPNVF